MIATLLPVLVVLFQPDMTLLRGLLAILLPGMVQMTVGNFNGHLHHAGQQNRQ